MTQIDQDLLKLSLTPELHDHVLHFIGQQSESEDALSQAITNLQNIADEWENETESPDLEDVRRLRDFIDEIKEWSDFEDLSHFHIDLNEVFD